MSSGSDTLTGQDDTKPTREVIGTWSLSSVAHFASFTCYVVQACSQAGEPTPFGPHQAPTVGLGTTGPVLFPRI